MKNETLNVVVACFVLVGLASTLAFFVGRDVGITSGRSGGARVPVSLPTQATLIPVEKVGDVLKFRGRYIGIVCQILNYRNDIVVLNLDGKDPSPCRHVVLPIKDNPALREMPGLGEKVTASGMIEKSPTAELMFVSDPGDLIWAGKLTNGPKPPPGFVAELPPGTENR